MIIAFDSRLKLDEKSQKPHHFNMVRLNKYTKKHEQCQAAL